VRWAPALVAVVLPGCEPSGDVDAGSTALETGIELVDASGSAHRFARPPGRIVSLVPAVTDLTLRFEETDRLVGRTDFDDEPELSGLPSVGGGLSPSLEVIVSLRPDLVIRFHGDTDRETPARLDELGIPHFAVHPETIAGIRTTVANVAAILGREAKGAEFLARADRALDSIRTAVADAPVVRTAFMTTGDPPWVAGPATYVGELLELCGGENAYADLLQPWSAVSPETLLGRNLDVLIVSEDAAVDPRISKVVAVRRVTTEVLLPGVGLVDAAREIAAALHPGLFPGW
jgi:iron complex transport system substrate-binding protein